MVFCSDWTKVEEDCRKAIRLDHNSVKVRILDHLFGRVVYIFLYLCILGSFSAFDSLSASSSSSFLIPRTFGCLFLVWLR